MKWRVHSPDDKIDHPVLKKLPPDIQREIIQAFENRRVPAGRIGNLAHAGINEHQTDAYSENHCQMSTGEDAFHNFHIRSHLATGYPFFSQALKPLSRTWTCLWPLR